MFTCLHIFMFSTHSGDPSSYDRFQRERGPTVPRDQLLFQKLNGKRQDSLFRALPHDYRVEMNFISPAGRDDPEPKDAPCQHTHRTTHFDDDDNDILQRATPASSLQLCNHTLYTRYTDSLGAIYREQKEASKLLQLLEGLYDACQQAPHDHTHNDISISRITKAPR